MSRRDELERLTTAWNDAWNSGDASLLADFFSPEGTYYEPDLEAAVPGAEGIATVAERTWKDWPKASFEEVSKTIEEPRVVLEWRSTATHQSGKVVNLEGVDVLEWSGDKLSSARVYYDIHARKAALGS